MTDTEDRELRALLHDAVADVEPARTPDDLHTRLHREPRRAWVPLTVAAAVATALVLVGVPWLADRGPSTPPAAAPADTVDVVAYAVVETPRGPRLVADRREVEPTGTAVETAVEQTLYGSPTDPDYRPVGITPELEVSAVEEGGLVRVDLALPEGRDESWAVGATTTTALTAQALVWAAASTTGDLDLPVQLTLDGSSATSFFGTSLEQPLTASRSDTVLAPVTVDSVSDGQTFDGPFTVSGLASAFEGTVTWRLLDGDELVREGFTTAAECCTPSPYSFEVDAPPGDYVLEVGETNPSDGEGFPPYVDTKRLAVR